MKTSAVSFFALLGACSPGPQVATAPTSDNAFAAAYALFVGADAQECVYWLTDTGISNPDDITRRLARNGYDLKRGIETLYDNDTPPQCIARAQRAATKAGFSKIRARLATEKDRFHGIP